MQKVCVVCGSLFESAHPRCLCCSLKCSRKRELERQRLWRENRRKSGTPTKKSTFDVKECVVCGKIFEAKTGNQICCSVECRNIRGKMNRPNRPSSKINYYRRKKQAAQAKKAKPRKSLDAWAREAAECGMSYGNYRYNVEKRGKTFDDMRFMKTPRE